MLTLLVLGAVICLSASESYINPQTEKRKTLSDNPLLNIRMNTLYGQLSTTKKISESNDYIVDNHGGKNEKVASFDDCPYYKERFMCYSHLLAIKGSFTSKSSITSADLDKACQIYQRKVIPCVDTIKILAPHVYDNPTCIIPDEMIGKGFLEPNCKRKEEFIENMKCIYPVLKKFNPVPLICGAATPFELVESTVEYDLHGLQCPRSLSYRSCYYVVGKNVTLRQICAAHNVEKCYTLTAVERNCGTYSKTFLESINNFSSSFVSFRTGLHINTDMCETRPRPFMNTYNRKDGMSLHSFYLSLVNESLGICHSRNLWMIAFSCFGQYIQMMDFPNATEKNILTSALCKDISKLKQCWMPINTACPGEFVGYMQNYIEIFYQFCELGHIKNKCDIHDILSDYSRMCLDVHRKTDVLFTLLQRLYPGFPEYASTNLHKSASLMKEMGDCTEKVYNSAKRNISFMQCGKNVKNILNDVIIRYVKMLQNFEGIVQKYSVKYIKDESEVMNGFVFFKTLFQNLAKVAINYGFHGILFD